MRSPFHPIVGIVLLAVVVAVVTGYIVFQVIGSKSLAPEIVRANADFIFAGSVGIGIAAIVVAVFSTVFFYFQPGHFDQDRKKAARAAKPKSKSRTAGSIDRPSAEIVHLAVGTYATASMMVNEDGRIVRANSDALDMFGYTNDELEGQLVEVLIPSATHTAHRDLRRNFLVEDKPKRMMGVGRVVYGRRKNGTEFPIEVGLSRVATTDGPFVVCALIDISARVAASTSLEIRTRELERSNAELQQFAYVASHDLQEPLRMVSSFCELLKDNYSDKLDDDGVEFIEFAVNGARRMKQLINDLLDYSRLQFSDDSMSSVPVEDALSEAMYNLTSVIQDCRADIQWTSLPTVRGNRAHLVRLFQNLISNAIKFCAAPVPRIRISADQDGANWIISVKDNGIGIDADQLDHVFGVFQRLHTHDEYQGTGIGLAICKRIAESHGGTIWAQSGNGQGTTISFTMLPAEASAEPLLDMEPISSGSSGANLENSNARASG